MKEYSFSKQKGSVGHCFQAQVFRPDGFSLCNINPTDDENEASKIAEIICEAFNNKTIYNKTMRKLTDNQKEFLFNYFFKTDNFAGWKNIANSLLETGECIVAGDSCIWIGGIGNFIRTKTADGFYGCIKYKFDLEYFLGSELYIVEAKYYIDNLFNKVSDLTAELEEIKSLNVNNNDKNN